MREYKRIVSNIITLLLTVLFTILLMDTKVFAAESEPISASLSHSDAEKLADFDFSRYIANLYITDGDNPINNGVPPYEGKVDSYHNIGHPSAVLMRDLNDSATFKKNLQMWESLNFDISGSADYIMKKADFYSAVLLSMLNISTTSDQMLEAFQSKYTDTALQASGWILTGLKDDYNITANQLTGIKVSDIDRNELNTLFQKIMKDKYHLADGVSGGMQIFSYYVDTVNTMQELVNIISSYACIYQMSNEYFQVLSYMKTYANDQDLKQAITKILECKDDIIKTIVNGYKDSGTVVSKVLYKNIVGSIWSEAAMGSPFMPVYLAQKGASALCNLCLSTDEIAEQYYKMDALCKTEEALYSAYLDILYTYSNNRTTENAKSCTAAAELYFNLLNESCEYAKTYGKIVYEKSLAGQLQDKKIYNVWQKSVNSIQDTFNEEWGCMQYAYINYIGEDYPDIYNVLINNRNSEDAVPVTGVAIAEEELNWGTDDYFTFIKYKVYPENATDKQVTFKSSDPTVLTVKDNGLVELKKAGTARVTVRTHDGGYTDSVKINVVNGNGSGGCGIGLPRIIASGKCGSYAYWKLDENGLMNIYGNGEIWGGNYINGQFFYNRIPWDDVKNKIKKVNIATGITSVSSLWWCEYIEEVEIADSVTAIEEGTFTGCSCLKSIKIPDSVTQIGDVAFLDCIALEEIELPKNLKRLGKYSYSDNGHGAFKGCTSLKKIDIPASLTEFGEGTFSGCTSLTNAVIEKGVTEIGYSAFTGCSDLKSVSIPDTVVSIGWGAFANCKSLKQIELPNKLQTLGNYAFNGCSSLEQVYIPASVTALGTNSSTSLVYTFYGCNSLKMITVAEKNKYYKTINGILYSKDMQTLYCCPEKNKVTSIKLGANVQNISEYAFHSCKNLVQIEIPNSIKSIGSNIFEGCSALSKVNIPNSLSYIPRDAFKDCLSLGEITIPDNIKDIGSNAFINCKNLKLVNIENGLQSIASNAFYDCINLKSIEIPDTVRTIGSEALGYFTESGGGYDGEIYTYTSKIKNFKILCCADSAAENYAEENKFSYEHISHKHYLEVINIKEPTCTEKGENRLVCVCGMTKSEQIPAKGHKWDSGVVTTEPTYTETGIRTYKCSICYKTKTEIIAPLSYKITYNANGGKGAPTMQSKIKDKAITLSKIKPVRTGYTFKGWSASKTAVAVSYQPGEIYKINKELTLYAVWKANTYKVAFHKNGGSGSMSTVSRTYNKPAALPDNAFKRSGYKFKGWNTKSDGSGVHYSDKASVKNLTASSGKTVTLYAQWVKGQKLIYNANGGKISAASKMVYKGFAYGTLSTPTKKGYTFAGWYTAKSGGSKITSSTKVTKSSSHTLYAQWKPVKYTVKYVLNGGKNHTKNPSGYYISTSTITLQNPTRTGYRFQGWYTSSNYKTKVTKIPKGSTGSRTLYAKWASNIYTIRYNKNGAASGSMADTKSCRYGTAYTLRANTFKKTGYTFAGWSTSASGAVTYKDKADVKNLTSTNGAVKTLYAKWTPNVYKINYYLNGGVNSSGNPSDYKIVTSTITLKNPNRTGYTFSGWYTSSSFKTEITQISKGSTGTKNLYAKWTANSYTIHYDANGGNGAAMQDTTSCKYDTLYSLNMNSYTRSGYKFVGWNTQSDGSGEAYEDGGKVKNLTTSSGKVTLYAQWETLIVEVTQVEVSINTMTVKVGDEFPLGARITPVDATDPTVTWSSSDTSVIEVDANGYVKAVGAGEADVTATANNGVSDSGRIIVESSRIPIATAEELAAVGNDVNADYELTADIDLSGYEWSPVGSKEAPFTGSLEGNNHTVTGLTITDSSRVYSGLFGYLKGTVQNMTVEGQINLTDSNNDRFRYAGGIAGYAQNAHIKNCINYVTINAENRNTSQGTYCYAGGIAGCAADSTVIEECTNYGEVYAGALEGTRTSTYAGGITGDCINSALISECTNNGGISAHAATSFTDYWTSAYAGGISGEVGCASVKNAMNNHSVSASAFPEAATAYSSSAEAGGIAGHATVAVVEGISTTEDIKAEGNDYAEAYSNVVLGRYIN